MATVKVIVMAKTKMGKTLNEGLRDLGSTPTFIGQGRQTYAERLLGVKSQGIIPGHNESGSSQKTSL